MNPSIHNPPTSIVVQSCGTVEHLTLNRPATLNALDDEMTDGLLDYFQSLQNRPSVRVVLLRGAGRGFCSGLDLASNQAERFVNGGAVDKFAVQQRLRSVILAMRRCPQPIVAAVHGVAAGGGFVLAMASDIRVAAEDMRMHAAFVKIGVGGGDVGASYLLPRIIGGGPAAELLLTGRAVDAERALRLGLVSEVSPLDKLDTVAQTYVEDLLGAAPLALRLTKEVLNVNLDAPSIEAAVALEDRTQVILGQTQNFVRAVDGFRNKRPVTFTAEGDAPYGPTDRS